MDLVILGWMLQLLLATVVILVVIMTLLLYMCSPLLRDVVIAIATMKYLVIYNYCYYCVVNSLQ